MAELAEEYSRLTKKILTHCIQGVIAIHVLLLVCENEYISYVCTRLFVCSRVCVFVCVCLCVRGFYIIHSHAYASMYIFVYILSCYTYGVYILTYNTIQTPNTHTHTHIWNANETAPRRIPFFYHSLWYWPACPLLSGITARGAHEQTLSLCLYLARSRALSLSLSGAHTHVYSRADACYLPLLFTCRNLVSCI